MDDVKKTRPDVKERLQNRKTQKETVIKCSLNKVLKKKELLGEIHERVLEVSKATNRGSLVFNRLLLHCLKNDIQLPDLEDQTFFVQCLNIGLGRLNKPNPLLKEIWSKYFEGFPVNDRCIGNTQAIVYASKKYMTNFKNFLIYPFERRQKSYISRWCKKNNIDAYQAYPIRCAINGWKCKTEAVFDAMNFVEDERNFLKIENGAEISFEWLKKHPKEVLRYYYHILCCNELDEESRKFTLAPVSRIKNHFMTIDSKILYSMAKKCLMYNGTEQEFRYLKEKYFKECFNYKKLCHKRTFSFLLETDGTSVCLHFHSPKQLKSEISYPSSEGRIIAIDPGRCNLIFGVEEMPDGTVKKYKLRRSTYYNSSGIVNRNRKSAKWEKDLGEAGLRYNEQSIKTTNDEDWKNFLEVYVSVYDILWEGKTKRKRSREDFRVYCLKHKTLDKFFQTMARATPAGEEKPVIAYGAAKFSPTGKHELSAPTTFVSKRCSKFFRVTMIDEYNTTKICNRCHERLHTVKTFKTINDTSALVEVRGLRWCCSTNCRCFLDRDFNSALNIKECFMYESVGNLQTSEERKALRPLYFSRDFPSETTKQFILRDHGNLSTEVSNMGQDETKGVALTL